DWQALITYLGTYGIPATNITIKPSLARNWEYYTGIVFELTSSEKLHIGGGGRYNDLIQLISQHQPTPAVGFAYNMNNLVRAIPYKAAPDQMPLIELQITPQTAQIGIQWAQMLRQKAVAVTITAEGSKESVIALWVDDAGHCHTQQRVYTPDEIEQLVADLKELTS
ncbi:MAG: ATP phosphoribosyltransferase regulatory subunit, partial [Anaerolineae bacterium]|nr:ATP phosphoribosyltransferase regulatory subunit [Anaerolineae bacterium]